MREALLGASISSIVLTIKFGYSGLNARDGTHYNYDKKVYLYKSKRNGGADTSITTGIKNAYLDTTNNLISELNAGAGYGNTKTYTFSGTDLTNLANAISGGCDTFCIYNSSSTKHYAETDDGSCIGYIGAQYLSMESVTITVTYRLPIVWVSNGTKYVRAIPWVSNGTKYVRAVPWTSDGTTYKIGAYEPSS